MEKYCVDHIIPLKYFNFLYLDGSINKFEIRKAWSPANLRIITKEENGSKAGNVCILSHPLRFQYVFDRELEKAKECELLYKRLNEKNIKEMESFSFY